MSKLVDMMTAKPYTLAEKDRLVATLRAMADDADGNYFPAPDMTGVYPADHPDALTVSGNRIQKGGVNTRLKGVSLLSTVYENPRTLCNTLGADATLPINVVRIAIIDADGGNNGWNQWSDAQRIAHRDNVIIPLVNENTARGWYSIIDYHNVGSGNKRWDSADTIAKCKAFWAFWCPVFKGNPRVIFEMFNEPADPTTYPFPGPYSEWLKWRTTFQPVLKYMRYLAPRNHIIVSSPAYAGRAIWADTAPFVDSNISYTSHFYPSVNIPGAGVTDLLAWLSTYIPSTVPVFLTEFGYSTGTAWDVDITNRPDYATAMYTYLQSNQHVSFTMWSYGTNAGSLSMLAANGASEKAWLSTLLP